MELLEYLLTVMYVSSSVGTYNDAGHWTKPETYVPNLPVVVRTPSNYNVIDFAQQIRLCLNST